jgi:hypothetical protein
MFGSNSSDLHVINRPITRLTELPQAVTKPLEEFCGFWHILYLWPHKRINHQQIVGFFLKTVLDCGNFADKSSRFMLANMPEAECGKRKKQIVTPG